MLGYMCFVALKKPNLHDGGSKFELFYLIIPGISYILTIWYSLGISHIIWYIIISVLLGLFSELHEFSGRLFYCK